MLIECIIFIKQQKFYFLTPMNGINNCNDDAVKCIPSIKKVLSNMHSVW